jgi:hypothetical protein
MKGFKAGLTILLNCKDSEVFKSLKIKDSLTVNDLLIALRVRKGNTNEIFSGDLGAKILGKFSKEDIVSLLASSKLNPSLSPKSPSAQGQAQGSKQTPSSSP